MRQDNRSPIWGGATLGLGVGVVVWLFSEVPAWSAVGGGVVIGALVGAVAGALGLLSDRLRSRGAPKYVVSEQQLQDYFDELSAAGIGLFEHAWRTRFYATTGIKPEAFGVLAAAPVTMALAVVKAVFPSMQTTGASPGQSLSVQAWPAAKEALAFALHAIDRIAFEVTGDEGRDIVMAAVVPQTIELMGTILGDTEDRNRTLDELDAISREYGSLQPLLPEEGQRQPSVLEVAHSRILATGPDEQDPEYQAAVLLAMTDALSKANLRDTMSTLWAVRSLR